MGELSVAGVCVIDCRYEAGGDRCLEADVVGGAVCTAVGGGANGASSAAALVLPASL